MEQGASVQRMMCPACNARYEGGQFCAKDGTPLVKDQFALKEDFVGQVLADRYRIVRLLGEGGMGQVYEAQHVNINKRFAIKMLRPEIVSNQEAVQRFRQEAWSASSIGHDNIIEIDDFATLPNGSVYLAMEFLAGQSLAERMRSGAPIELGEALEMFVQVCRGLQAAHEKNIIHRDMKPENVFLSQKHGRTVVKILDFGIAKVSGAEGSHSLTRTGAIFGTPHYMSPEQALGKPLDLRSDVYSVGVIMYEVFTGRVPFEAESFMGILTKHITSEPKRPTEAAPERHIPPEIEAIILHAMAKDANERYASMNDLQQDLLAAMQLFAPHLLSPSGNLPARSPSQPMLAASSSAVMRARTPSQPVPITPGSGARPMPVAPTVIAPDGLRKVQPTPSGLQRMPSQARAAVGASPSGVVPVRQPTPPAGVPHATGNFDDVPFANPEPKKKSSAGIVAATMLVLLGGGAAAAFVIFKKPAAAVPTVNATTSPSTSPTASTPAPTPATMPTPAPEAAKPEWVIVDTEPPQAKIFRDGVQVGETPETVKVPAGETVKVVLKKDGYVEESVVVDPSKGHKVVVKLDKEHAGKAPAHRAPKIPVYSSPGALPSLPKLPPSSPSPEPRPPVVTSPPPRPKRPANPDPYERLDDAPARPAPKKGTPDVLNPY